jgi:hypothetical protein
LRYGLHQRVDKPAETWGNFRRVPLGPLPPAVPAEPSGFSHEMGAVAVPSLSISRSNPPRRHEKYKGA